MHKRNEKINRQLEALRSLIKERDAEIVKLRRNGCKLQEIAELMGLTHQRVSKVLKREGA